MLGYTEKRRGRKKKHYINTLKVDVYHRSPRRASKVKRVILSSRTIWCLIVSVDSVDETFFSASVFTN